MNLRGSPYVEMRNRPGSASCCNCAAEPQASMAQSDLISPSGISGRPIRASVKQLAPAYALAMAVVGLAFALRSVLAAPLGNQALYLFLVPPVLLAGVIGGRGPGLFATFACLIIHLYV